MAAFFTGFFAAGFAAGVWVAAQPDDDNHRFGHGKAEALAAMFQVVLISISALSLALRAVDQWLAGTRPAGAEGGIVVSSIAMVATIALLAWQRRVIRKTGSLAISTDHVHYQSDLLLNLAVIAALVLDQYLGIKGADPLFGLAIAAWLGYGAYGAAQEGVEVTFVDSKEDVAVQLGQVGVGTGWNAALRIHREARAQG